MSSVLSVQKLTVRYGDVVAVDSLSLHVRPGEVFGLLGPNGSGKSTTLAAIAGDLAPTRGEIRIAGVRERDQPATYRRSLGLVPQELALFDELSAIQNVTFFARLYGLGGQTLPDTVRGASRNTRRPSSRQDGDSHQSVARTPAMPQRTASKPSRRALRTPLV